MLQQINNNPQNHQQNHVVKRKGSEVVAAGVGFGFVAGGVEFEGNYAGHGSDEGAEAADVYGKKEHGAVLSEAAEKQGSRNVTDYLACDNSCDVGFERA